MKKLFVFLFFISFSTLINAQEISDHAIGLRFGNNDGLGTEISYQKSISDINRIEIDLGWRNSDKKDAFKLTGIYQWVWQIDGNFNWFAGAGGGIGSWSGPENTKGSFIFACGDIGIEYNFDFPLLLSLDTRPELGFNDYNDGLHFDIALSARYQF